MNTAVHRPITSQQAIGLFYFKIGKEKKERANRTHRLCIKGGVIESIVPELTDFSEPEFYDLMETVFSLSQVQSLVEDAINQHKSGKKKIIG